MSSGVIPSLASIYLKTEISYRNWFLHSQHKLHHITFTYILDKGSDPIAILIDKLPVLAVDALTLSPFFFMIVELLLLLGQQLLILGRIKKTHFYHKFLYIITSSKE